MPWCVCVCTCVCTQVCRDGAGSGRPLTGRPQGLACPVPAPACLPELSLGASLAQENKTEGRRLAWGLPTNARCGPRRPGSPSPRPQGPAGTAGSGKSPAAGLLAGKGRGRGPPGPVRRWSWVSRPLARSTVLGACGPLRPLPGWHQKCPTQLGQSRGRGGDAQLCPGPVLLGRCLVDTEGPALRGGSGRLVLPLTFCLEKK